MPLKSTLLRTALATERLLRPIPRTPPHSILILQYLLPLGCCVHLTPLYEALKQSRPDLTLTVATRGLAAQLNRHNPHIDHLLQTPDALTDTLAAARHLRTELRRRNLHPDLTLTGGSDNRTRTSLLAVLASPARRAGYTLVPQLYDRPYPYDPTISLIDNNLRLTAEAACPPTHREPSVFFSPTDVLKAKALTAEANPNSDKPLVILVTQPSGGQSTGWHQDRFAEVARAITQELGCALAFVGIPADHEPIEALRGAAAGAGTNLAGRTSITELAALLATSDYLISLDTGTMHLGRAVGLPLVVLGPSWQKPIEWLPVGQPDARILRGPDRPDVPPNYRLDEISALDVLEALRDLMTAYPASHHARSARTADALSTIDHLA